MEVVSEGRSIGREGLSYTLAMAFVATIILLATVFPSQGMAADFKVSETCYGTGNCSLHMLSCAGGKLAVLEASYGFQLQQVANKCVDAGSGETCPDDCCSYNETTDCKVDYSSDNLQRVQSECSHSTSCHTRAQWANNVNCLPGERATTSTVSILRAVCVPDATAVNPCSNTTVSGHSVSLDAAHPPLSSPCQCTVHKTITTTTSNDNNNGIVELYVYEVVSSSADWEARVDNTEGTSLWRFSGEGTSFPASLSWSSPESSLPLSATFSFGNLTDSPQRVWLGFRGEEFSLTLRCGQDAVDYAMSLTTTTTTTEATTTATTTITPPATTSPTSQTTPGQTTSPTGQMTDKGGADSSPLTSEPPQEATNATLTGDPDGAGLATTDIIVYTVVGVVALLLCAFLYVFIRQLRKKGCPVWCPPPCHDLQCGKLGPRDPHPGHHPGRHDTHTAPNTTTTTTTITITATTTTTNGESQCESGLDNGSVGHGDFVQLSGGNGGVPLAFTQRRCSFEHLKRHRGSVQSLRRASFSNLEDITETEEDEEDKKEATLNHTDRLPRRHHPHHSNDHLHHYHTHGHHLKPAPQFDVIKIVDEHIAAIEADSDKKGDDDDSQSDEDHPKDNPQPPQDAADPQNAESLPRSAVEGETGKDNQFAREDNHSAGKDIQSTGEDKQSRGKDNQSRDEEGPQSGASVVFHLGDGNESSDPDLEQYFTQL